MELLTFVLDMKSILTSIVALLFHSVILYAQSPGGVEGSMAWMIPEPMTTNLGGQYHWVDYSGNSIRAFRRVTATDSLEFQQPADSLFFLNFHPALSLSADTALLVLPQTSLGQYTVIGVFAPRDAQSAQQLLRLSRNGYEAASLSQRSFSHGVDSISLSSSYYINRPRIVTLMRSNTPPVHTTWGHDGNLGSRIVLGNLLSGNGEHFLGYCAELIIFNRMLNFLERCQIETYLALKYGVTQSNSYFDSGGNQLWSKGPWFVPTYNNRMMGVMRDSISNFYQTITTTSDTPFHAVTFENSSNYSNSPMGLPTDNRLLVIGLEDGEQLSNGEYAILGDNGNSYLLSTSDSIWFVMRRSWLVRTNSTSLYKAELSYKYIPDFNPYRANRSFLVISSVDTTHVTPTSDILIRSTDFDAERQKIIFHNIPLDVDGNRKDLISFAYSNGFLTEVVPENVTCLNSVEQDDGRLLVNVTCGTPCYEYFLYNTSDTVKSGRVGTDSFVIDSIASGFYHLSLRQTESTSIYTGSSSFSGHITYNASDFTLQRRFSWCINDTASHYNIAISYGSQNLATIQINDRTLSVGNTSFTNLTKGDSIVTTIGSGLLKVIVRGNVLYSKSIGSYSNLKFSVSDIGPRSSIADLRYNGSPLSLTCPSDDVLIEQNMEKTRLYSVRIGSECGSTYHYATLVSGGSNAKPFLDVDGISDIEDLDLKDANYESPLQVVSVSPNGRDFRVRLAKVSSIGAMLLVYDTAGRLLSRSYFSQEGTAEFSLPYAGVFLVRALTESGEYTEKITVK